MPGAIAEALKNAQYLAPLAESLRRYKAEQDYQQGLKNLFQLMTQLQRNTTKNFRQTQEPSVWTQDTAENNIPFIRFSPESSGETINQTTPTSGQGQQTEQRTEQNPLSLITNRGEGKINAGTPPVRPEIEIKESPEYEVLGNIRDPRIQPGAYKTALDKTKQDIFRIMVQGLSDKNIDPERLTSLLQIYQSTLPSAPYIPKKETKQIGDYAYTFDGQGNIIAKERVKEEEFKDYLRGPYKHRDTDTYWLYDVKNREGVDTGIPYDPNEGRAIINTGDETKPLDTYKFIEGINIARGKITEIDQALKNPNKYSKYYYNGREVRAEELGALKKRYEGELKAYTDSMIEYLEEYRYSGIKGLVNELWNEIKDVKPDEVGEVIEKKLTDKPEFTDLPEDIKADLIESLRTYFINRKY